MAHDLNENDFECHRMLSAVYLSNHDYGKAEEHGRIAYRLNPNDPNFKSSADRKMETSLNFGLVGEQTSTLIRLDVVTPLEYSPYGTEVHTSMRFDF